MSKRKGSAVDVDAAEIPAVTFEAWPSGISLRKPSTLGDWIILETDTFRSLAIAEKVLTQDDNQLSASVGDETEAFMKFHEWAHGRSERYDALGKIFGAVSARVLVGLSRFAESEPPKPRRRRVPA